MSINIINRNNTKIYTTLTLSEEGNYPKFWLRTKSNGFVNHYEIKAKISGLLECKESSLYFSAISVENMNEEKTTNEETLIDEAIIDIFEELTQ